MSEYTPGPWVHDKRGYPHPDVKAANGRNIACTWGVNGQAKTKAAYDQRTEIARANAQLIAAAPELLEALKESVKLYESYGLLAQSIECGKWVNDARAAIAKAEGGAA